MRPRLSPTLGRPSLAPIALALALAVPAVAASSPPYHDPEVRLDTLEAQRNHLTPALRAELDRLAHALSDRDARKPQALGLWGYALAVNRQTAAAEAVIGELHAVLRDDNRARVLAFEDYVRARIAGADGRSETSNRLLGAAIRQLGDDPASVVMLSERARLLTQLGRLDEAYAVGREAVARADRFGLMRDRITSRVDLAFVLGDSHHLDPAEQQVAEARALAQRLGSAQMLSAVATVSASLCEMRKDLACMRRQSELTLEQDRLWTDDLSLAMVNLSDVYLLDGQAARALPLAREALEHAQRHHNVLTEPVAWGNIGIAEFALGRPTPAKRHMMRCIALATLHDQLPIVAQSWSELGKSLESAGDLLGAWAAYGELRQVEAELSRRMQARKVLEMQEGFEAEQRQRQLDLLDRENRLKAERIAAQELARLTWTVGAISASLATGLLLLMALRVRQRNQALLATNTELTRRGLHDSLTGLPNRRHVHTEWRTRTAIAPMAGTLFLIDVDHFKAINDRWGHGAGDAVLVVLAQRLRAGLRDGDLIARWGGEEFLIWTRAGDDAHPSPDELALRLLQSVAAEPVVVDGQALDVQVSIGYVTLPLPPNGLDAALERALVAADATLYWAKSQGRHRAVGLGSVDAPDWTTVEALVADMGEAVARGALHPHTVVGSPPATSEPS